MTVKIDQKLVYKVISNSDNIEGRGNPFIVGYFIDQELAREKAKHCGLVGRVEPEVLKVVIIEDNIYLLGELIDNTYESEDVIKSRALAKLSEKERKILGIK